MNKSYKVVSGTTIVNLELVVNQLRDQGWMCQGGVAVLPVTTELMVDNSTYTGRVAFYQAMIRI